MQELKYPKTYGTIMQREGSKLIVVTDTGELIETSVARRNGYGHAEDMQPGRRIKLYKRPQDRSYHFRFVGS